MSRQPNRKETAPAFRRGTFWAKTAADVERLRWRNQPTAARVSAILAFAAFLSFLTLFFWHSRGLLVFASILTWFAMTYTGAMALFGSRAIVLSIMWRGRRDHSQRYREIFGRVFGAAMLAFMIFAAYEILHGGLRAAYDNFGR